jgi:hypothetical protein
MTGPRSATVIASLAVAQGITIASMGLIWLQVGSSFNQEGGLISLLIAMIAAARGWLLIFLSLLYLLFAVGAWQTRAWAWGVGLLVSVASLLIIGGGFLKGGLLMSALAWLIVPVVMIGYLLSPTGRQALVR